VAGGHVPGKAFIAFFPDGVNTGDPVGPEDKSEDPGHEIIENTAFPGIPEISAISAGSISPLQAAGPYPAPGSLFILAASGTLLLDIPRAGGTIEPAKGYKIRINRYFTHGHLLLAAWGQSSFPDNNIGNQSVYVNKCLVYYF